MKNTHDPIARHSIEVVLAHHFSADRLLLNFACSCQRLGHSVTVITAKGDPAKPRSVEEGPTVEVPRHGKHQCHQTCGIWMLV